MSDVLAAAAGSRFEPPAAGAPGGRSGPAPRVPSGTGSAGEGAAGLAAAGRGSGSPPARFPPSGGERRQPGRGP